ncbi:NAD(P)-dependent oxidoreductase [Actinoplanes subtropicus]|uniref:NAD(P)-dependent oxidoreductase n=1 Tax=Actinoplanes subtropicus TaxID=543632 RepID=UPI0004C3420F|nr:NAD(P)-dependent oxidoreductase [Actinoplanes subtropicus]
MSEVGWIGAGRMGAAMARRLLAAGYGIHVWNRTREKAEALAGAKVADAVDDLAGLEVVVTTVADDASLLRVTIGEEGLLRGPVSPRFLIDASTVAAETSERVRQFAAERGTTLLAAPVSGNPKVVRAGRASIVVSGPKDAFAEVEPLLRAIGAVTYVGGGDQARLVKLAHNVLLGVVTQALAEVTVMAQRGGVPRSVFLGFLNDSVLGSVFSRYKSPALVNLDLTPTFTTDLLRKDFDLGLAAARGLEVPMPVAAAAYQLVQAAAGRGHGDADFAALIVEQARSAGLELEPEHADVDDGLGS